MSETAFLRELFNLKFPFFVFCYSRMILIIDTNSVLKVIATYFFEILFLALCFLVQLIVLVFL